MILLVSFSKKHISYSTYSKNESCFFSHHVFPILSSKSVEESCNQAFSKLPYKQIDFIDTKVAFYSPLVSLFPVNIDNENCQKLFAFEHGLTQEDFRGVRIKSIQLGKLTYILPEDEIAWTSLKFKAPDLFCARELILNYAIQSQEKDMLLLNIQDGAIELVIKTNNDIQFQNHFEVTTSEDILYYTLYSLEQLKITRDKITCFISGNLTANEIDIKEIRKFLKVEIALNDSNYGSPEELNSTFFSSIQMLLCE